MKKSARKSRKRQDPQRPLPLAEYLRGRLHEFVVDTGLTALSVLLEEERTEACGPRYRHDPARQAHRSGHAPGELVLGGRRVTVQRPRARTTDGQEVHLPSWDAFADEDPLEERTVEQMVLGVSTRKYDRSLETVPEGVSCRGASKSAASRRFVRATKEKLGELMGRDLGDLDLVALMLDGVHFADHVILIALGIDSEGRKHVLGVQEGATENATSCKQLLTGLRQRGLRTDRSLLCVIDGGKALRKALVDVLGDRAVIQRCQVHKLRNVLDQLPDQARASVKRAVQQAYRCGDATKAKKRLTNLARRLESEHPGAAASLLEGLDETLTVMRLELPRALARTLSTTNAIENLIGRCRAVAKNVKRWNGGVMVLRWVAAGLEEAAKGFRRLRGCVGMPALVAALRARDAASEVESVDDAHAAA